VRERKITEFELKINICIWFPNKFTHGNISLYFIHTSLHETGHCLLVCHLFLWKPNKNLSYNSNKQQLSACFSRYQNVNSNFTQYHLFCQAVFTWFEGSCFHTYI